MINSSKKGTKFRPNWINSVFPKKNRILHGVSYEKKFNKYRYMYFFIKDKRIFKRMTIVNLVSELDIHYSFWRIDT